MKIGLGMGGKSKFRLTVAGLELNIRTDFYWQRIIIAKNIIDRASYRLTLLSSTRFDGLSGRRQILTGRAGVCYILFNINNETNNFSNRYSNFDCATNGSSIVGSINKDISINRNDNFIIDNLNTANLQIFLHNNLESASFKFEYRDFQYIDPTFISDDYNSEDRLQYGYEAGHWIINVSKNVDADNNFTFVPDV